MFHLVEQRVSQQNAGTLIQFTAKIDYSDNSSVLLNSLDAFRTHVEVRPIASVAVHLSWTYLIQFQGKTAPEKQQIDVTLHGASKFAVQTESGLISGPGGYIFIRISHTARTWGVDMESLLLGHFRTLIRAEPKIARRFKNLLPVEAASKTD